MNIYINIYMKVNLSTHTHNIRINCLCKSGLFMVTRFLHFWPNANLENAHARQWIRQSIFFLQAFLSITVAVCHFQADFTKIMLLKSVCYKYWLKLLSRMLVYHSKDTSLISKEVERVVEIALEKTQAHCIWKPSHFLLSLFDSKGLLYCFCKRKCLPITLAFS